MPMTESAIRPRARRAANSRSSRSTGLLYCCMGRLLCAVLVALAAGAAPAQEPPPWFSESLLDLREDVKEAAAHGKRVMLYFGQDGCPYCKRLMDVNFRQAAIAAKAQRHLVALALNIWGDREVTWTDGKAITEKQLAARLKVQF